MEGWYQLHNRLHQGYIIFAFPKLLYTIIKPDYFVSLLYLVYHKQIHCKNRSGSVMVPR